jgi:PAS domain S-box-containing protein
MDKILSISEAAQYLGVLWGGIGVSSRASLIRSSTRCTRMIRLRSARSVWKRLVQVVMRAISPRSIYSLKRLSRCLKIRSDMEKNIASDKEDIEALRARLVKLEKLEAEHTWIVEAFRESEERFRGAFESSGIGMAVVGTDGRWQKVNRALCDIAGYSEQEMLIMASRDIVHPDDAQSGITYMRRILNGEINSYNIEKRYMHKQGHAVWILLHVSLVKDTKGKALYFVYQVQDITGRKVMEEELRKKIAALERFRRIMVGRELRMKELKAIIAGLEARIANDKRSAE